MSRPMYETEQNRNAEQEIIRRLVKAWRCDADPIKLPIKLHLDYLMTRDGLPAALVEIKDRTCNREHYPTAIVSLHKLLEGRTLAVNLAVPFLLVYRWTNALGFVRIDDLTKYKVKVSGTEKRGDPQDIEPQAYIPVEDFVLIPAD